MKVTVIKRDRDEAAEESAAACQVCINDGVVTQGYEGQQSQLQPPLG